MRFDFKRGLIRVTFELIYEGARAAIDNCIIDTGSATTAVEIDLININFRKPAEITRLYGIGGGIQEVIAQKTDAVIIDKHELKN
ncbi:MAG: hypothetical protein GY859_07090, partial [Desulfobacterales bacterium]|nr:hypothetical protein [Desulfobacterales bacterium]